MTPPNQNSPKPVIKYPANLQGLTHIPTYPATYINTATLDAANKALASDPINGHRQAYLILYAATGNPAFRDNLFIATRTGTIGGVAWNANQQILEKYPDEYPKDANGKPSIAKFSWLVGQTNLAVIKETSPGSGQWRVPSEAELHDAADHATWKAQDLAGDGKLGDLNRVSPPGFLVSIDSCTTSLLSRITSTIPLAGEPLAIGFCTAKASLNNPEASEIAIKALGRTMTQNAISGDANGKGKVWVGQNIYEVAADLQAKGINYSIAREKDTIVIKDANGVIQGAWTEGMIQETTFQRAMKTQNDRGLRTLEEGYREYFNSLPGAKEGIENKLPSLQNIQGYKISEAEDFGNTLADLGRPDYPWLASADSETQFDVGNINSPLANSDFNFQKRAEAWRQTLGDAFNDARVAFIPDPEKLYYSSTPVLVDRNGAILGYISIDPKTKAISLQLGAADQFTVDTGGKIIHSNTAPQWLDSLSQSGNDLLGVSAAELISDPEISGWSFEQIVWHDDVETTYRYDESDSLLSVVTLQTDEDGNVLKTKINAEGIGTANVYDESGDLIDQATIQKQDGINGTTGKVTLDRDGHQVTLDAQFGFDEETGEFINITGVQSINGQTPISDNLIDNAIANLNLNIGDILLGQNTGALNQLIAVGDRTDSDGWKPPINTDGGGGNGTEPSWYQTAEAQRLGGALTDIQSLVAALKSDKPLPIATSVFNLASHLSRHVVIDPNTDKPLLDKKGNEVLDGGDETLGNISEGLNDVTAILNFRDALKRGDIAAVLSSGANLAKGRLELYQSVLDAQIKAIELSGDIIGVELATESAFVNNLTEVLPYVGLINGLAHGDVTSVITSIAAIAGIPYVGWIVAGFEIVSSIFGDLFGSHHSPDIYGDAVFVSNGDGIHVHPVLTSDHDNGGASVTAAMQSILNALESTLKGAEGMGLIAQRLPHLHFKGYNNGGGVFTMYYSDAVTGKTYERNFDAEGNFIGISTNGNNIDPADAGFNGEIANSPDFFKGMGQQFVEAAYRMGAVAPQWMVKTVDAQASQGQNIPGYTTLQRAAALGQLLSTDPGDALHAAPNAQQTAQPIVLDLDSNGISVTTRAQGGSVLVDVDGDGFAEETDWINPRDGFLVIDKNGDGKISGGTEIFNDSQVDMGKRGLHALDELDANGDGKITNADFGFTHLSVWQDINHDGQVQDFELSNLMQRGISEININSGQFVMAGQVHNIQNVALQADSAGFLTQPLGNSLLLTKETGESSLLASALADYGQVDDSEVRKAHTHTSADGLLSVVDELMDGLEDVSITVSVAQLLDNDSSVTGTTLSIIAVNNALGGTVNLDQVAGT
jgi:hypothetical protein